MKPYAKLIETASFYVGVSEQRGVPNGGPNIEEFQKAINGVASGEPWCAGFVGFCIKKVEEETGVKTALRLSEHVLTMWNNNPDQQTEHPMPGFLAVWRHGDGPSGHIGIVEQVVPAKGRVPGKLRTIEGNTSSDEAVVREGDGVFRKERSLTGTPSMKLIGFLDPWS